MDLGDYKLVPLSKGDQKLVEEVNQTKVLFSQLIGKISKSKENIEHFLQHQHSELRSVGRTL